MGNHCLYQAAFEDGSHFSNPSSYLAGLISEYFQGAPRIPYKPVFLDGWSPGYVTFAEENQVIVIFSPNLQPQLHGCNCICVFLYLSISPLPTSPDDSELSLKCIYSPRGNILIHCEGSPIQHYIIYEALYHLGRRQQRQRRRPFQGRPAVPPQGSEPRRLFRFHTFFIVRTVRMAMMKTLPRMVIMMMAIMVVMKMLPSSNGLREAPPRSK